jgi:GNAT superfamily N-acetyltransferase
MSEVFSDHSLACRLERSEARANAGFVDARARLYPNSGATWIEVAGAYAMFDGPCSPCTQTLGLGLFAVPSAAEMDRIESFFRERNAPVLHEVSPLADKALLETLNSRGYQPVEFTSVMFQVLKDWVPTAQGSASLHTWVAEAHECDVWAQTSADGWSEFAEYADVMRELARVVAYRENGTPFLVELEGQPIATGDLAIHSGVALLAGASTVPKWRRQGAQNALLESRLSYAKEAGCDLAMFCAEPGSASQRNGERHGFRIAYTRIKYKLAD